jgi:hypothetical protein
MTPNPPPTDQPLSREEVVDLLVAALDRAEEREGMWRRLLRISTHFPCGYIAGETCAKCSETRSIRRALGLDGEVGG